MKDQISNVPHNTSHKQYENHIFAYMGRKKIIHRLCKCGKSTRNKKSGYCKECHNAYQRANRKRHSELTNEQRQKANCRSYLNVYIKRGKITKPLTCSISGCMEHDIEAHHDDYSQPLFVKWLCHKHHSEIHQNK